MVEWEVFIVPTYRCLIMLSPTSALNADLMPSFTKAFMAPRVGMKGTEHQENGCIVVVSVDPNTVRSVHCNHVFVDSTVG